MFALFFFSVSCENCENCFAAKWRHLGFKHPEKVTIEIMQVRVAMHETFAQVEDVYEIPEEDFDRLLKVSDVKFAIGL